MIRNSRCIYVCLLYSLLISCAGSGALSDQELKAWLTDPEHGVIREDRQRDVVITACYRPVDLIIAQDISNGHYSHAQADSLRRSYDSLDYFVIKIAKNGQEIENSFAGNPVLFSEVISYLNGGIAADITLRVGTRVIGPEAVVYMRGYGATGASSLMVVFRSATTKTAGNIVLQWEDTTLGTGNHNFSFKVGDIRNIPLLKI